LGVDVVIYESGSGGELQLLNDDLALSGGLANQVYLAFFGGNLEQSTSPSLDDLEFRGDWWGNQLLKTENQFNSELERTLQTVALNSAGLRILENAAKKDLEFLKEFAEIDVKSSITGINKTELFVTLQEPGQQSTKIKLIWDGTRDEAIFNVIL